MKRESVVVMAVLLILALLLLAGALGATPQGATLTWWALGGGGGQGAAGPLGLQGSIGQPVSAAPAAGGEVTLGAGFWSGAAPPPRALYLPAVLGGGT